MSSDLLYGVNDQELRFEHAADLGYIFYICFRQNEQILADALAGTARSAATHSVCAHLDLLFRLLPGNVEDSAFCLRDILSGLQDNSRLPYTGFSGYQGERFRNETAAKYPVQFFDARIDPGRLAGSDAGQLCRFIDDSPGSPAACSACRCAGRLGGYPPSFYSTLYVYHPEFATCKNGLST